MERQPGYWMIHLVFEVLFIQLIQIFFSPLKVDLILRGLCIVKSSVGGDF